MTMELLAIIYNNIREAISIISPYLVRFGAHGTVDFHRIYL